jgi:hypothetical protein
MDVRQPILEFGDVARRAHAAHHVLALGVGQEVARWVRGAGQLVARKRDAAAARVALVAEDHLLDVDRGAPVVGDAVDAPVLHRAAAHPGVEDCADRAEELVARLGRERVQGLERRRQLAQGLGVEPAVVIDAAFTFDGADRRFEALGRDARHDVAVHLHQAPVGVPGEAFVAGALGQPDDAAIVHAEVQDRVHHPRHRFPGATAHRHEQGVVWVAERLARVVLQAPERRQDRVRQTVREIPTRAHVGHAGLGGDGEAGRDALGAEHARHLRDVGALAAQQIAHVACALRELVHPPRPAPVAGVGGRIHRR